MPDRWGVWRREPAGVAPPERIARHGKPASNVDLAWLPTTGCFAQPTDDIDEALHHAAPNAEVGRVPARMHHHARELDPRCIEKTASGAGQVLGREARLVHLGGGAQRDGLRIEIRPGVDVKVS